MISPAFVRLFAQRTGKTVEETAVRLDKFHQATGGKWWEITPIEVEWWEILTMPDDKARELWLRQRENDPPLSR